MLAIVVLIAAACHPDLAAIKIAKIGGEEEGSGGCAGPGAARRGGGQAAGEARKGGGKKKGALARMKKGGGGAADDDDDDDDGPAVAAGQESEASRAQREAIKENEMNKEEKRRKREEEREEKQRLREEKEKEEREAAEKKKQEEFEEWSKMFSVEETGADAEVGAEDGDKLTRFVGQIKDSKVSVLEELASEFGMKVSDVLERLNALEAMGHLTGVIDERGKFIFITKDEMLTLAKFVQKKGRVRISTLAQESNRLIDLTPRKREEEEEEAEGEAAAGAA